MYWEWFTTCIESAVGLPFCDVIISFVLLTAVD